jgi:hypothetical protein
MNSVVWKALVVGVAFWGRRLRHHQDGVLNRCLEGGTANLLELFRQRGYTTPNSLSIARAKADLAM